jgi:hypothetical protein
VSAAESSSRHGRAALPPMSLFDPTWTAARAGASGQDRVVIGGDDALVARLADALRRVLGQRGGLYRVRVDWVGRGGEVVVAITGAKGRLPLLLGRHDLDPDEVERVVEEALERYSF